MAHIPYVPYDEAEGLLAELYERFRDSDGMLDNIIRIHSLNPRSMNDHIELYSHLMRGPSPLSRTQREMVAVTVSAVNGCFYWINHHGAGLRTLLGSADIPRALARDYTTAELAAEDRAMLDYAVKLTLTPHEITEVDISNLRSSGFDETAILDLCQVVSYYNYVNRLADGLGVELENYWEAEEFTMTREEFDSRLMETE